MFWIGFIIGFIVGGLIGIFIMCLMTATGKASKTEKQYLINTKQNDKNEPHKS